MVFYFLGFYESPLTFLKFNNEYVFFKSQQDLTLLDLEPEQMTKQSKTRRRNSRDLTEELDKKAEREFCVQEPEKSLWYSEFKNLKNCDFKKSYNANESIKTNEIPTSNHTNGNVKTDNSPEEINYAFSRDSFIETCEQRNKNGKSDLISVTTSNENKKDRKLETGSASKRKYDIEMSVFENPMISQFVEDEDNLSSSSTSPSHRPLLKGYDASSPSRKPLLKGDSQDSSTSVKSQLYEPQTQSIERHDQIDGNVIGTDDKSQLVSADDYEDTDLIAVDVNSGMYSLNDSQGSMVRICLPLVKYMYILCTACLPLCT